MKKEEINVIKYFVTYNDEDYTIYLMPNEEQQDYADFYIQKKGYGNISFTVGVEINKLGCNVEEYIDNYLTEWIQICENDIKSIETIG